MFAANWPGEATLSRRCVGCSQSGSSLLEVGSPGRRFYRLCSACHCLLTDETCINVTPAERMSLQRHFARRISSWVVEEERAGLCPSWLSTWLASATTDLSWLPVSEA